VPPGQQRSQDELDLAAPPDHLLAQAVGQRGVEPDGAAGSGQ